MKSVFIPFLTRLIPLLLVSALVMSCSEKATEGTEKKAIVSYDADVDNPLILKSLEDYKELALKGDGPKIARMMYKPSFAYYEQLRQAIFHENKEQVQARSYVDQVIIMRSRISADIEILEKLDSLQFVEYLYRSGYVDKGSVLYHGMGEITYDPATQTASAPAIVNDEAVDAKYHFKKEEGIWKLDISEVVPFANTALEEDIVNNGNSPEYMLHLTLLSANSGQEVDEALWSPRK